MISVIIPIYNTAPYIERCINSILKQTYKDIEIILIDDGSTDNSGKICDDLASKNPIITCIHQKNKGTSAARKKGISVAKGEWIMFIDSDDTIPPNSIKNLSSCISETVDLIIGSINVNNRTTYKYKTEKALLSNKEYIIALLQNEINCSPCAKLYRKKIFDNTVWETPNQIYQNEDLYMLLCLALKIRRKIYIRNDIIGYNYIFRPKSASKKGMMPLNNWIQLFDMIEKLLSGIMDESIEKAFYLYRFKILLDFIHTKHIVPKSNSYIHQMAQKAKAQNFSSKELRIVYLLEHPILQSIVHYRFYLQIKIKHLIKQAIKKIWKNSPY